MHFKCSNIYMSQKIKKKKEWTKRKEKIKEKWIKRKNKITNGQNATVKNILIDINIK